jgi:hypothetical protein
MKRVESLWSAAALLLWVPAPLALGQSPRCWTGSFSSSPSIPNEGTFYYSGSVTLTFDSPQWSEIIASGQTAFASINYSEQCSGTRDRKLVGSQECSLDITNEAGRARFSPDDQVGLVLVIRGGDVADSEIYPDEGTSWSQVQIGPSEISSNTHSEEYGDAQISLEPTNCRGDSTAAAAPVYVPPQPVYSAPPPPPQPPPPPPPSPTEQAADRLLNDADRLLATQGVRLTYVSFANHNGLHPDGTWGVGLSNNGQNEADSIALNQCNSRIPYGEQQCGSDNSCALSTGQWAAHAVATGPFMDIGGFPTGTSCGAPTQAAAQAQALQNCQSSAGVTCNIVWTGAGN